MQKWEYLFVSASWESDQWRVKFINGKENVVNKNSITIHDYANKIGEEGWELISAPYTSVSPYSGGDVTVPRLIFKRPKM